MLASVVDAITGNVAALEEEEDAIVLLFFFRFWFTPLHHLSKKSNSNDVGGISSFKKSSTKC